ncbi:BspA family leucine-rich repeat surface protein [uncultured Psychrosphaera sp.]|uniref:BspA family leucine-rich repeat surface protein n=1 Tax=uncultured Psychrosphaera sp. TaxID=1403522 RepID=UPI00261BBC6A|nr:BspA family leucine-rich repeat surface protein [uncultured Psychrosphaera sp.]
MSLPSLIVNNLGYLNLSHLLRNSVRALAVVTLTLSLAACGGGSGDSAEEVIIEVPVDDAGSEVVVDTTAPIITLNGDAEVNTEFGNAYIDLGAIATDERDGTVDVVITGLDVVDTSVFETYIITYTASDSAGNTTSSTRTVTVVDTTPPLITLEHPSDVSFVLGNPYSIYEQSSATAVDLVDGAVDVTITGTEEVDTTTVGSYKVTFTATDARGNEAITIRTVNVAEPTPFITTWQTNHPNANYSYSSGENQIKIGTYGSGYDFTIDWGDGTVEYNQTEGKTHTYVEAGTYTITITGTFPRLYSDSDSIGYDNRKLLSVEQWGNNIWQNMAQAFHSASNMNINATDTPDLSQVTNMYDMFYNATSFNSDISQWNVSNITNMERMFYGADTFNQNISEWDVSSVTSMERMFSNAYAFNQYISQWNVSNVITMEGMFSGADAFNQDISQWDVSSVITMESMFSGADAFNQDISQWIVSNVTTMKSMFSGANVFNQDISGWDVSSVESMEDMFNGASVFNQYIGGWDVSSVTDMESMFEGTTYFNQDLSLWDVSKVTTMAYMFHEANAFNQDISNWQISNISTLNQMFYEAHLSVSNYDALLDAWSKQTVRTNVNLNVDSYYSSASSAARGILDVDSGWDISDLGKLPETADQTAPIVSLIGNSSITISTGTDYVELGALSIDDRDGAMPVTTITGTVDTSKIGQYILAYIATDAAGNKNSATRTVNVVEADILAPVISLSGKSLITLEQDEAYFETGATAVDARDGILPVITTGYVDDKTTGTYTLTYSATDVAGNTGATTRSVIVPADITPPNLTLNGNDVIKLAVDEVYTELNATATDWRDGVINNVEISGTVNTAVLGDYIITYTAQDSAGNEGMITRIVQVLGDDIVPPEITLTGGETINWTQGFSYSDLGFSTYDARDGDITVEITGEVEVDTTQTGSYTITYTATDAAGNETVVTRTVNVVAPTPFVTVWQTDAEGGNDTYQSDENQIRIGTTGSGYDFTIDWGDGTVEENQTAGKTHTYTAAGTYTITITGAFPRLYSDSFFRGYDNAKLLSVEQWGNNHWASMEKAFHSNLNLVINAADTPVLHQVTSMAEMFYGATKVNSDISNWDVSTVTDMREAFYNASSFDQNISGWDVSNVTDMSGMFNSARVFNQDISSWDVSNVTDMASMFNGAYAFDQPIGDWGNKVSKVTDMSFMLFGTTVFNQDVSGWDISNVTNMSGMFGSARIFNQDLSSWKYDVSNVTDMSKMFNGAESFNKDISDWDVSNVTDMSGMFRNASLFNQDISGWDVSNVTDMSGMFQGATIFNQDIGEWDVLKVTSMEAMFYDASNFNQNINEWNVSNVVNMNHMFRNAFDFNQPMDEWANKLLNVSSMNYMFYSADVFNQDVSQWDVSNVTDMSYMFYSADVFNQDISGWDVSSVTVMSSMLRDTVAFNQNLGEWNVSSVTLMNSMLSGSGLSTNNYDALLNGWSLQTLQLNVRLDVGSNFSATGEAARESIINIYGWTIYDDGLEP